MPKHKDYRFFQSFSPPSVLEKVRLIKSKLALKLMIPGSSTWQIPVLVDMLMAAGKHGHIIIPFSPSEKLHVDTSLSS
ncbi:hypothetical protein CEXT_682591 [Caerostris extrusa]|uniref:Uncharacterized protein n=1 Tax=Caerostris extrusa TaxID=172846 RepID=A0AAV4QKR2_CAEEX|nr:hypothetical protein CEXT_682591 [Caerostris extrusa]